MLHFPWLIPLLPVLAFAALAIFGGRMSRRTQSLIGAAPCGAAAVLALATAVSFMAVPPAARPTSRCGSGSTLARSPRASPSTWIRCR